MSALPRHLADKLTEAGAALHMDRHVAFLHAAGTAGRPAWSLRHLPAAGTKPGAVAAEGGEVTEKKFDAVLLALPAPQAVNLLAAIAHPHAAALASVAFAPCWTAMAAFGAPIPGPDIFRPTHAPLGWAAREGSRPGHAAAPDAPTVDAWVLQATGAWSREHLEQPAGEVAATLLATFLALAGRPSAAPRHLSAHRWRYALVETPLGTPCLWDPATAIGVCGDFCLAPRVEAAWQSGTALASAVLSHN
jgi:predicted NAD/FAD-dependent oxidoreductase